MPSMTCSLIALLSDNNALAGPVHSPLWRAPWLASRVVQVTRGKPVILGRKAFHYMNMLGADRWLFVVTRDEELLEAGGNHHLSGFGFWFLPDLDSALQAARSLARTKSIPEFFVAGGAGMLQQALPHAERLYRTVAHESVDGAPVLDPTLLAGWRVSHSERRLEGGGGMPELTYSVIERPRGAS